MEASRAEFIGTSEARGKECGQRTDGGGQGEWGLDASIEGGMQRARMEWEQKEEQRKKIEERKEEQKKEFEFQKKQQEDIGLKAAQGEASAENKAWGAG